jgi:putative protease
MKSPDYVYTVVSTYRALLDANRPATEGENDRLRRAFSRGGFTDGYFVGKTDKNMTGMRTEEDKRISREDATGDFAPEKHPVRATVRLSLGEPSEMTLTDGRKTITVKGDIPSPAENSPLTEEGVKARLSKMGSTNLLLPPESIDLSLEEGINLPPSSINALRRAAAEAFESNARPLPELSYEPKPLRAKSPFTRTATFHSESAYLGALSLDPKLVSRLDIAFLPITSSEDTLAGAGGVFLPPVYTDSERDEVVKLLEKAKNAGVMYALVSNIGQIALAKSLGLTPIGDFRLNITNSESAETYRKMGLAHHILSPELTLPKARDIGGGLITYGRIPLMIPERCFIKENFGCDKCTVAALTDRRGEKFPIMREYSHRNLILNSRHTYMGDRRAELDACGLRSVHFIFTTEPAAEIFAATDAFRKGRALHGVDVRRVGRRKNTKK